MVSFRIEILVTECGSDAGERKGAELSRQGQHRAVGVGDRMRIAVGNFVIEDLPRYLLDRFAGELPPSRFLPRIQIRRQKLSDNWSGMGDDLIAKAVNRS